MRVVVFGGAGAMGRFAVKDLSKKKNISKILIADCDLGKATELATEAGSKCEAILSDVNLHKSTVDMIKGYDIALGAAGPFYKLETKMAKACIEAKVNYISICNDFDAVAAVLKLNDSASKAGLTMVSGCGWAPGITNLLALYGSRRFDEIDSVEIAWGCHSGYTEGKAAALHKIHIFSGDVPSFINGRTVRIPAGSGRERISFPQPVGDIYGFHLGHPEPVTIPKYIQARNVTLKGGFVEEHLNILSIAMSRLKLTDTPRKKDLAGALLSPILPYMEKLKGTSEKASACRVDVTGKSKGKLKHESLGAAGDMDLLTGLPLSLGAQIILEGKVEALGVFAPEAAFDAAAFLKKLKQRGIRFFRGDDMKTPLSI